MTRALLTLIALAAACAARPIAPARVDTANDACRHCRMIVSDVRTAAQIVAPGEEPLIFDDIGCLRDYVARMGAADGAVRFVADHRTGAWIAAEDAMFTKVTSVSTPMASGIIAHADRASRDADPAAANGQSVDAVAILGGMR
jgi:copper chaperone NosL